MSNNEKNNDEADLEWLNLKKNKGQTPDYIKKAQIENVGSKFMRKFKENPFVPVGKLFNRHMVQRFQFKLKMSIYMDD